jgi:hypothetical protein
MKHNNRVKKPSEMRFFSLNKSVSMIMNFDFCVIFGIFSFFSAKLAMHEKFLSTIFQVLLECNKKKLKF